MRVHVPVLKNTFVYILILKTVYIKFATKFVTHRKKRWRPYKIKYIHMYVIISVFELSWFIHARLSIYMYAN